MSDQPDYYDSERFEMTSVPWRDTTNMESRLIAEGWFHPLTLGFTEEDLGVFIYVRERRGYTPPKDKTLVCKDCHKSFMFTVDEQKFFKSKGFIEPKRCPSCRKKNKG